MPNESLRASTAPRVVNDVLAEKGEPLDDETRAFMEPRFHHDFAQVQVHADAKAAASARAVDARAYAVGRHVVFGANQYSPGTREGRELLAHELAHSVQQRNPNASIPSSDGAGVCESTAQAAGSVVAAGNSLTSDLPASAVGLARTPDTMSEADRKKLAEQIERGVEIAQSIDEADEIAPTPMALDPRISKGAKPTAATAPKKAPIKPKPTPSIFSPGGFTPEVADKLIKEAEARTHLGSLAMDLAEKQARRFEFFDRDPSHTKGNVIEAAGLDIYWDEKNEGWQRQAYVDTAEAPIDADPELHELYSSHLWVLMNNKPVEVTRADSAISWVCQHTNPCKGDMEQFHADREGGMSLQEARNRGMFRTVVHTAEMLVPGKGDLVAIEEPTVPTPNVTAPEEIAPNSGTSRVTIKASPPPPPGQTQRPGAPEPVTDVEVVKTNVDSPSSIETQPPTAHQTDWTARGGAGTAPPAYRDSGGNVHVSSDHPLRGDGSRGGIPPVRPGAPKPAVPTATRAQPNSPPSTAKQTSDVGEADTGHPPAPAKPAVDPMAKTPPAPQPAPVSPQAQTGEAAAESQRPQAPRGHMDPDPPQAVSREVVENMRNRPRSTSPGKGRGSNINYSTDHGAHEQAWHRLRGHGDAPPAFIYDNQVYLDPSRFH